MCPVTGSANSSSESDSEISDSLDSDSSALDVSMSDSSSDDSDSDSENSGDNEVEKPVAGNSSSVCLNEDGEEEEDEVIKAILREKNKVREYPPDIECEDFVVDLCFHPHEDILVAAMITGDALVYKYSKESNENVNTLELHLKACRDVEFNEDGTLLYSSSKDKSIMVTDFTTGKLKNNYDNAHEDPVNCLLVIDSNIFASGDDDGTVKLWDLRQRDPVFSVKEMEDYVNCMITSEAKRHLVCGGGDGTITSINIGARKLHIQSEFYDTEFTALGTMKHERKLVASTTKGSLFLFNWGEFGYHSDEFPGPKLGINCLIPITENIVVTAGEDGILRATHLFPHRHLGIAGQHQLSVECMDISHSHLIASFGQDQLIKFWNIKYFENVQVDEKEKSTKQKRLKHNLPSSKFKNASDFFADLA